LGDVREEARREAAKVIASGKLYVCEAGGYAVYAVRVSQADFPLIENLPRYLLPSGCAEPRVQESMAYAEVFNGEIVRHLRRQGKSPD
jgi:hypothetical protein